MITTIHKTKPLQNIIYALSFWSAFISFLREIRSRKLFTGNLVRFLRIFLVHKCPCLKINSSENASFVEILIWEEKKWECSTYPVLKHTKKSETTLHFKYTKIRKTKETVTTKWLFHQSHLNSPLSSKTIDLPTFENWYFSSFWNQNVFEKYTEMSKLLAEQQDHLMLRTTWYWAILCPPRSVTKLIKISLQSFAN